MIPLYVVCEYDNPKVQQLEKIISKNLKEGNAKHAARNYRDLAKYLYRSGNFLYALDALDKAAHINHGLALYQRELQDRRYRIDLLEMQGDRFLVAAEFAYIAGLCKNQLNDKPLAFQYYKEAALNFEKHGNYFACHKMAYHASLCTERKRSRVDMLNIAIRASIKQDMFAKVIFYVSELLNLHFYSETDAEYLSLCQKGYYAAKRSNNDEMVVHFLTPLINAHVQYSIDQIVIKKITFDYLCSYIRHSRSIDCDLYKLIDRIYTLDIEKSNILNDLSAECERLGMYDEQHQLKIRSFDYLRKNYWDKNKYGQYAIYSFWRHTSLYGESLGRWTCASFLTIFIFSLCYYCVPNILNSALNNFLQAIYFSTVTFTTLGYGDLYPCSNSLFGQLCVVTEVIIGYMMLGGLVSIFTKKIVR